MVEEKEERGMKGVEKETSVTAQGEVQLSPTPSAPSLGGAQSSALLIPNKKHR